MEQRIVIQPTRYMHLNQWQIPAMDGGRFCDSPLNSHTDILFYGHIDGSVGHHNYQHT